jgi:hypothetical protein
MFQVDVANNRVLFVTDAIPSGGEPLLADDAPVRSKRNKFKFGEFLLTLATCSTIALIIFVVLSTLRSGDNNIHGDVDDYNSTTANDNNETDSIPNSGNGSLVEALIGIGWPVPWIQDPSTPQYQAARLVTDSSLLTLSSMLLLERYAFFVLFFATSGETWTHSIDRMIDGNGDICAWTEGVVCREDDSSVIKLHLGEE